MDRGSGRLDAGHRRAGGAGRRNSRRAAAGSWPPFPPCRAEPPHERPRLSRAGFEEIEAITVIDILRRAEIETVAAGLTTNPIVASRQTRHLGDVHLADIDTAKMFEIVVLPGGVEGAKNLAAQRPRAGLAFPAARTGPVGRGALRGADRAPGAWLFARRIQGDRPTQAFRINFRPARCSRASGWWWTAS